MAFGERLFLDTRLATSKSVLGSNVRYLDYIVNMITHSNEQIKKPNMMSGSDTQAL